MSGSSNLQIDVACDPSVPIQSSQSECDCGVRRGGRQEPWLRCLPSTCRVTRVSSLNVLSYICPNPWAFSQDVVLLTFTLHTKMTAPRHEFLSFGSDEDSNSSPIQSHLDTLFAEFTRTRRRLSPPRSPTSELRHSPSLRVPERAIPKEEPKVDLRALDYVSDYDSHLMCPICHVPFVEPIVLDCDHTFCTACFEEYRDGADHSARSQCPTCRAYLLARPQKASRLIVNMCNDLKVRCPNEDCDEIVPRGYIEPHATRDCPEWRLDCPDINCRKMVKRKNFVPDQCIHSSHIECDCGAVIELGRGEWLKHKDEDCPTTGIKCDLCDERISVKDYLAGRNAHVCRVEAVTQQCPGAEYGCIDDLTDIDTDSHVKACPLARLAPTLKKQSEFLKSLNEQLTLSKVRNEVLETGLDKINNLIHDRILYTPPTDHLDLDPDTDVEEIPRQPSPPAGPSTHLSLPAHLRPLTPTNSDLLSLHSTLQDNIGHLSSQVVTLQNALAELDARTSMTMMNETLRLKEDLAHQSAGLFSTRAQVQWLLNRERERMVHGQQMHHHQQMQAQQRGRAGQPSTNQDGAGAPGPAPGTSPGTATTGLGAGMSSARTSISTDNGGAGEGVSLASSSNAAAEGSTGTGARSPPLRSTTLPMPIPGSMASPRVRPQMRRLSGGSQERVKL